MKSQSQLQQQAAAAALAKKSGSHGAAGSQRRLRRNVDAVMNALANKNQGSFEKSQKPQRSHSSNASHQPNKGSSASALGAPSASQGPGGIQNRGAALSHQQQQQMINAHFFHRKQMMNSGAASQAASGGQSSGSAAHHSHSQQVLDNSQAIQQKINMYQNRASGAAATSKRQPPHSPINTTGGAKGKTASTGSSKIVPAQLSRAYLQSRQNQTPNPVHQAGSNGQPLQGPQQPPASQANLQHHINQMLLQGKRQGGVHSVAGVTDRNNHVVTQQNLLPHQNSSMMIPLPQTNNTSSYYDIPLGSKTHASSAQNLDIRAQSKPQSNQQPLIQIKSGKNNRNTAYGQSLSNRQKNASSSSRQASQQNYNSNTLYSQISLKEIQSPVKQPKLASKVKMQAAGSTHLYGGQPNTGNLVAGTNSQQKAAKLMSQKYVQMTQAQKKMLLNGQVMGAQGGSANATAFIQYTQGGAPMQHSSSLEEYVPELNTSNFQHLVVDAANDENSASRSRNIANLVTTNGITTSGPNGSQSAILNINTASDINIYNNSFIVRSSPKAQAKPAKGSGKQVSGASSNNSHRNQGAGLAPGKRSNTQKQALGGGGRSTGLLPSSVTERVGPQTNQNVPSTNVMAHRSMSTGRNQKSASGSRGPKAAPQAKSSRAAAISEAYNQANRYLLANQGPQINTNGGQQQITPNQIISRRELKKSDQMKVYSQHSGHSQQPKGKNYSSTEAIKRSEDSQLAAPHDTKRNSSLNRPQYNNLVNDSQKRLVFAAESGITMSTTKRSFKAVKKNRQAFNTQPVDKLAQSSHSNLARSQVKSEKTIVSDLITKGRQKIKVKEFNEAIKIFSEVLDSFNSRHLGAIFFRAISYLDQGNLQQAISELWRVVNRNKEATVTPEDIELCKQAYVLLSIAHKRLGEIQNAVQDLQQCIEIFPSYPDAYLARGQTLLLQEDFPNALVDFQKYITFNSGSISGHLGVGDCHKAMKNFTAASKAFSQAINLLSGIRTKPNYDQLYMQCFLKRGLSGYHEGCHSQALTDLQQVIQKDTSSVKAHFYIGKLLAKGVENTMSKQTDAILHFEQVAKYPDHEFYYGNALFQIAKLRLAQKDYYEAFHCLKRAADNNFSSKRLSLYKDFTEGVLYLIKRKIKKGVQILTDLLEILVNKDKEKEKKEAQEGHGEGKTTALVDIKKRQSDKAHSDYLIHQILLFRAYGYVAIEKYEVAQDDIKKVGRYGKIDAATVYNKWLGKGILRMDHEDYLMASKFFSKAWKKYPKNKDPYCLQVISIVRSYTYSLRGFFIDQKIKFEKVLETKKFMDKAIANCCAPGSNHMEPSLYFFRGLLNFQMHNFYDALTDFNSAISAEEDSSAYFYLARGRTYACLSILTEAMKDLSVALNLDETLQQAYIYRGKCAYLIGDNNLAFLDFQRLILTDPKNPMVHVYAGNLLMTTGAYQDAIKAYENADTVEPTTISAFQRVRCFCALQDLANAKVLLDATQKMQPDDVILKFDGLCLDGLISVAQATHQAQGQQPVTAAVIKQKDQALRQAIVTFDELIASYQSDHLTHLKRRDSILNVQVIPSVERIRIEKAMVAADVQAQRDQISEDQHADLPSISVDLDEPFDASGLKRLQPFSYYYENIFNLEDFFLYRAVFKFYQRQYVEALADFEKALKASKEAERASNLNEGQGSLRSRTASGLNTRNPTLQHFTGGGVTNERIGRQDSNEHTIISNMTDLNDIGLSSFNELEISYDIFLCHLLLNDKASALNKLNEIQRKVPKKYASQIPLLRAVTLDHLKEHDKAKAELSRLKKHDSALYKAATTGPTSSKSSPFLLELFPAENRLCSQFPTIALNLKGGALAKSDLAVRLSFSMPFIKPPNMIPNVDEEVIQYEFNLKQIDAPMPEAPWIKRCSHGIKFTDHITREGQDKDKYKKFFQEQSSKKQQVAGKAGSKGQQQPTDKKDGTVSPFNQTVMSARTRLMNTMGGETFSDRHKMSIMEDTASLGIENDEENCRQEQCLANVTMELNMTAEDDLDETRQEEGTVNVDHEESEDSYDSDDLLERGAEAMAIRESGGLIAQVDDSVVNMGENLTRDNIREIRKMKKEIVDPGVKPEGTAVINLLPKVEQPERNVSLQRAAQKRYAGCSDTEEEVKVSASLEDGLTKEQQADQQMRLTASKDLLRATEAEPLGLSDKMLVGQSQARKQRERRVSNLSIGVSLTPAAATEKSAEPQAPQKETRKNQQEGGGRRSLFRTSIDNEEEDSA